MVLVLLAAGDGKIGEAAHVHSTGAGDVREHAVENALTAVIGVETSIDEIADAAAGLRPPPRVGPLRSTSLVQQRIVRASGLQVRDRIANDRMAEPEDERRGALILELVDPSGLHPVATRM